jgi:hypothetical protein
VLRTIAGRLIDRFVLLRASFYCFRFVGCWYVRWNSELFGHFVFHMSVAEIFSVKRGHLCIDPRAGKDGWIRVITTFKYGFKV